ncbi:MAG: hypothetical protein AB1630_08440, partial [bacterium]
KEFMTISGYTSSTLEHNIWEKWYGEGAISAIKAIQIANESNIPVYDIDSSNVSIVDTFNIPSLAKEDIKNSINAGNIAKCPQSSINYLGWQGIGYIITDPTTGEGKYEIADVSGGIILITNPSGRSYSELWDIEMKAIEYAHKELTTPLGDPIPDDCTAFASFAQDLAIRWNEYFKEPTDFLKKREYFLCSLYDLSVSDDWYFWQFGLLGWSGPRILRPLWLNTHFEGSYDEKTKIIFTGGYKVYDLKDPAMAEGVTGKKDHFVSNALGGNMAYIIEIASKILGPVTEWVIEVGKEESTNDLKYNALGREFGDKIRSGEISLGFSEVWDWITEYLHGPLYIQLEK